MSTITEKNLVSLFFATGVLFGEIFKVSLLVMRHLCAIISIQGEIGFGPFR